MAAPDPRYKLDDAMASLAEYQKSSDMETRNALVMHFSYIPKCVAMQMRGLTKEYSQIEDVVNEGIITIMDCLDKYSSDKGMKFENYAFMRVRNATIDFIRQQDWVPRRVRKTARQVSEAYNELSTALMREPTNSELAQHLGMTEESIRDHFTEVHRGAVVAFEELLQASLHGGAIEVDIAGGDLADDGPDSKLYRDELRAKLMEAIDSLTEKERLVITLYYYEHLKLREIAEVMGVSESRVCQTNSKALSKLKKMLTLYLEGN